MDKTVTINKSIDLGLLTSEMKAKSAKVTGLSLNAGVDLIVHGADDLTDGDIQTVVAVHVKPVKIDQKQKFKDDIDASPLTPEMKAMFKRLADLKG